MSAYLNGKKISLEYFGGGKYGVEIPLEKGEGENSLQQVGCVVQSGLDLSNQEIKYVSFSYETNLLTVTTTPEEDGKYFFDKDENLVYGFRLNNVNIDKRPIVDIVAVIRESETDRGYTRTEVNGVPQWTFLIVSPLEMLNFDIAQPNNVQGVYALLFDNTIEATRGVALGLDSYVLNKGAITSGGYKNTAGGEYSFAGGWGAFTMGRAALAFGYNVGVLENYGVVLGANARAGYGAFAVNNGTKALGRYSVAFNEDTQARKQGSASFGKHTVANAENQIVNGRYNVVDENEEFAEITGNGVSVNNRSNARTLDWQGNEWLAGRVRVGANKALLPTTDEVSNSVRHSIEKAGALYANALKKTVIGNPIRIEDISPLPHKIKIKSTATKYVYITSKNLLDLTQNVNKDNCTVINSNAVQANINNRYFIALYPYELIDLLDSLDGYTITLSIAKPTNGYLTLYVSYTDGSGTEISSNTGETSVSLRLNHQGRQINRFEIRLNRRNSKFTDTETVIEDIQLEIGDRTDFAKPHSTIYDFVYMSEYEGEYDSSLLGTATTIVVPKKPTAKIEVEYNVDTKKYVDEAIDKIGKPEASSPNNSTSKIYYYTVAPENWITSDGDEAECGYYYYRGHDIIVSKSTTDDPYIYDMHVPSTLHLSLDYQGDLGDLNSKRMGPTLAEVQALQDCGITCGLGRGWNGEYECGQPICIRCTKNQKPTVTMRFAVTVIYPDGY